jgi:pSer/pThr/pTyr-binding forkhead associated (FHA) protein
MMKCPYCHFENEDGALFCEQCKSDLTSVAPAPIPMAMPEPIPLAAEPLPVEPLPAEPLPVTPLEAAPLVAEAVPLTPDPLPVPPMAPEALIPMAAPIPVEPEPPPAPPPAPEPVHVAPPPAPEPTPPPIPEPAPATAAAPAPAPAAPAAVSLPPGAQPRLLVLRGQKRNVEYPIYEGLNFIGRADEKPVDIDLEDQEPPDRVWCSRQHACISFENSEMAIEDLNSANGTYVNRTRVYPGNKRPLNVNDIIQIGNVQLKVLA